MAASGTGNNSFLLDWNSEPTLAFQLATGVPFIQVPLVHPLIVAEEEGT
jgi:hypothetical protein